MDKTDEAERSYKEKMNKLAEARTWTKDLITHQTYFHLGYNTKKLSDFKFTHKISVYFGFIEPCHETYTWDGETLKPTGGGWGGGSFAPANGIKLDNSILSIHPKLEQLKKEIRE